MLNPSLYREDTSCVSESYKKRGLEWDPFRDFIILDQKWRDELQRLEKLKQKRNQLLPKGKPTDEQRQKLKMLSSDIKLLQESVDTFEQEVKDLSLQFPNILDEDVPFGLTEEDNVEIRRVGDIPHFDFKPKSHDELGLSHGCFDFESGTKLAGSRFSVLKQKGAQIERALIQLMLDQHGKHHGYVEYMLPTIVNSKSLLGTGQLPKFSSDLFKLDQTDYWLSPTAEVQLTNLFRDEILNKEDLPLKLTAHTSCFRSEAGSYGKDVKGLIRQHQFNKVELVQIVEPEKSRLVLEELLQHAESILQLLELPYRVVKLCGADTGFSSALTYDIEVWFPSENCYREISSCSNFLDFQSRRAMIRYRNKSDIKYCHTINGSGVAVGRCFAAILENFQDQHGCIKLPKNLVRYCGFEYI